MGGLGGFISCVLHSLANHGVSSTSRVTTGDDVARMKIVKSPRRPITGPWQHFGGQEPALLLLVGTDPLVTLAAEQITRLPNGGIRVMRVPTADEAIAALQAAADEGADVPLLMASQVVGGGDGIELLATVRARWPRISRVILLGSAADAPAAQAACARANVAHVVVAPWLEASLHCVVESVMRLQWLETEHARLTETLGAKNQALLVMNRELEAKIYARTHELAEANARLAQLAITDGLTGLYNHRYFHERLVLEGERAQRTAQPVSLLMIDVDYFKAYNDAHGHPAGDELLRQLSRVLLQGRRANDVVARYGGEEFCILLVDTPKHTAAALAERIRAQIVAEPFAFEATQPLRDVTVSIGVATLPDDASTADSLVSIADSALYSAKRSGRNRVELARTP